MPRKHRNLLGLIFVLALVLRLYELGRYSFWLDEILTVQLSVGRGYAHLDFPQGALIRTPVDLIALDVAPPAWRIWTSLDRDVHPPLFYLVLRAWREAFGDGDARIRALSVVLSLGAIAMLYLAVEPLSGRAPALWAALLTALAGPQIEYAQETRSYMLLLTALLGAAAAIVRIEKFGPSRGRLIALGASTLGAALTHYAAMPALACLFAYVLIRLRGRALNCTVATLVISGAIFAIAWGPLWLRQMRGFADRIDFTAADAESSASRTLVRASVLPLRFFTQSAVRPAWIGAFAAVLYVLPAALIFGKSRRSDLLLWWIWLIGYVSFITLGDLVRDGHALEWIRYTLPATPAAYALAGALLAQARGWRRHIVPAALAVACALALPAAYTRWKSDWRALAAPFTADADPLGVIMVQSAGPDDWRARTAYLCLRYYAPRPPMDIAFLAEPNPSVLEAIKDREVWLLGGGQDIRAQQLFPGREIVEMHFVPTAGTLVRLKDEG